MSIGQAKKKNEITTTTKLTWILVCNQIELMVIKRKIAWLYNLNKELRWNIVNNNVIELDICSNWDINKKIIIIIIINIVIIHLNVIMVSSHTDGD